MTDPNKVEGVPEEVLQTIRDRVLAKEEEQLDYKMVHGLRPELKEIVEQEVTEEHLE
jgi:hypothetical protein